MRILVLTILVLSSAVLQAQNKMFVPTVLVEFYSSEGCSSCPQADQFGSEIRKIAETNKQHVYTIDWHVDLWDKSGWVDPYSDSIYTFRQEEMAIANNQKAMFTPMVFVNGKGALPAGAKGEVGKLIESALRLPASNYLLFNATWMADSKMLLVDYDIKGKLDSLELNLVLTQNEAFSIPNAGENQGKQLNHHNVVVKLVNVNNLTMVGTASMPFAVNSIDLTKYKLVGILQHKKTRQITACQVLEFTNK